MLTVLLRALTLVSILFWNTGGLNDSTSTEFKKIRYDNDADVFIIVEVGKASEYLQYYNTPSYSIHSPPIQQKVATSIIIRINIDGIIGPDLTNAFYDYRVKKGDVCYEII